jgi:Family of unknown function (DUF6445)
MFNPDAKVERITLEGERPCLVIDGFLRDPESWIARAEAFQSHFVAPHGNAYPGHELRMPDEISQMFADALQPLFAGFFAIREILDSYSRLSMVTRPPDSLEPRQWICHRDRLRVAPGRMAVASVLYLFKDPALGGTKLFRPRQDAAATDLLVHDSSTMDAEAFSAKYGLQSSYMTASNAYFELIHEIPAKWNRLVVYDGMIFHSGDIRHPGRLSTEPRQGRLSLNGFFTGRTALS